MRIRNRKINPTMVELIIGIVAYGILGTLLWVMLYMLSVPLEKFFDDSFLQIMIGFVIGIVFSIATIIHMTSSVETALEMGEHGALKHTRISYIVRMVALIVVFALMIIFDIGNIFAVLFGLLSLKLSAYAQPITHKILRSEKNNSEQNNIKF